MDYYLENIDLEILNTMYANLEGESPISQVSDHPSVHTLDHFLNNFGINILSNELILYVIG